MIRGVSEQVGRIVNAALPAAILLPLVAGLTVGVRALAPTPRFSIAATFTLLVAIFLVTFVTMTRSRRPRAGVLAACHALAWAPFVAVGVWSALDDGIVAAPAGFGCGLGLTGLFAISIPLFGLFLLLCGISLGVMLAKRSTDGLIRKAAVAFASVSLFAFAFALPRVARPDPDTYLASMILAGEIPPDGSQLTIAGRPFHYERVAVVDRGPSPPDEQEQSPLPRSECQLTGLAAMETYYPAQGACPLVRVRVDRKGDLAVLESGYAGEAPHYIAFRPSNGIAIAIPAQLISDRIGPPIGWTIGAGVGGLIGAVLLVASKRMRRRAQELRGYEGEHTGQGWVELDDGRRFVVDAAADLPLGEVVLGDIEERIPTYREAGAPAFRAVWAGRLADLRNARSDVAASVDAIALTVAVLGATPLVVARILGAF